MKSGDPEKDKTMVEDLLAFKQDMDGILTESFGRDEIFGKALRDAFETFINERHNKPAELIAKFIDTKLRSGYKVCTAPSPSPSLHPPACCTGHRGIPYQPSLVISAGVHRGGA